MANQILSPSFLRALLPICVFLSGCGGSESGPSSQDQVAGRVRNIVARILKKDAGQIDDTKTLYALGGNEADIVNITIAIKDQFKVDLPNSAIGKTLGDVGSTMTVQKLAEIVVQQQNTQ